MYSLDPDMLPLSAHSIFHRGGRKGVRNVTGLGTAQRNVSAALVVTLGNFADTNALPFVLVASIVLPLILISTAKRLGARIEAAAPAPQAQ